MNRYPRQSMRIAKTGLALAALLAWGTVHAFGQIIPNDTTVDFVIDASSRLPDLIDGETTSGSAIVTVADTDGLSVGVAISGTGIPLGASILSVDSPTQITISTNASATNTDMTFNVAPPAVPTDGTLNDINSIQVTDTIHRIIDTGTGTLRVGADGSIRREPSPLSHQLLTVLGGSLTAGGADNTAGNILLRAVGPTGDNTRARTGMVVHAGIVDNGTGAASLSKSGNYIVELAGNNTYTGGTTVESGYLRSAVTGNLGTGDITVQGTGLATDGGVHLNGGGVYNNDFFVSGSGADVFKSNLGGRGAIWLGNNVEVAGTVTLQGNTRITSIGASASEISGQITGNYALEIGNQHNTAQGTTTLSNPDNDWTGDTSIRTWSTSGTSITVILGASEVIPHGPGMGNLLLGVQSNNPTVTIDLNGYSETINGLISYGTTSTGAKRHIRSNADGVVTFTVGAGNADGDFFGQIMNGHASAILNLTKIGSGTQILRGAYTYTGATEVEGGTLDMRGTLTGTSGVTVHNGAAFHYSNGAALDRDVTVDGGAFRHTSAANYAGTLTFTSGRLEGTNWLGNLSGLTIGAGREIAPGTSPGAATTNDQTWESGGAYAFEINAVTGIAGEQWDLLTVNNALDISALSAANPFVVRLVSLTAADEPGLLDGFDPEATYQWTMVQFGSLVGPFSTALFEVDLADFQNELNGGFFEVRQSGDTLALAYIPEPGSAALLLLGAALLLRRRLRG